jgi:hypothetical protein
MKQQVINLLDQLKYKVFGQASSIDEAREVARDLLKDSHKHDIEEALDFYHNTVLNEVLKKVQRIT